MRKVHTRPNLLFEYIQPKNTARHTSKAIDPAAPSSSPRPTRTSASSSSSPQIPTPFQRAADDPVDVPDVPRVWDALREPFMWQVRELGEGKGVKILWWFVAVVDGDGNGEGGWEWGGGGGGEGGGGGGRGGGGGWESEWVEVGEACGILEFESDREVVRGAVRVLADTLGCGVGVCVREWKGVCG
ncbi:hypothetical protein HBI06_008440 [Parastagonospora nodorum]|nr:hypothetical protein HBI06_008440 [Parastagonospora nodorum]